VNPTQPNDTKPAEWNSSTRATDSPFTTGIKDVRKSKCDSMAKRCICPSMMKLGIPTDWFPYRCRSSCSQRNCQSSFGICRRLGE
jgi:hypothetical protein